MVISKLIKHGLKKYLLSSFFRILVVAVFSEYMAAVFLETYLSGSLFDKCKKGSAADFLTRPGGRTDLYHFLGIGGSATIFLTRS